MIEISDEPAMDTPIKTAPQQTAPLKLTRRGVCFILSAPSGAGKSTIARHLREAMPNLHHSISVTTRPRRPDEEDGIHYYFRTSEQFEELLKNGGLVEWAQVFGNLYGTPRAPLEAALSAGRDIILDVDWQGYRLLKKAFPRDVVGVFILPPSLKELEKRLNDRGSDAPDVIAGRMNKALDEIGHWPEFDYVVINDDLEKSLVQVRAILQAAKLSVLRCKEWKGDETR